MKTPIHINHNQLLQILMGIEKTTKFNFMVTTTKVRMNKTNNPYFDKVLKTRKFTSLPIVDFEKRVNNIREKNGLERDFVVQESKVGIHVSTCVLYNEKYDRYYFNYEFFGIDGKNIGFEMENENIERELFREFEVKQTFDPNKPKINSVTHTNIIEISLDKNHYIVDLPND